ncbi:unnamed protein product [Paramecium sonneborni]|uniref:Tetratricopeptide repeat protein 8 n=1 Tax=Paramecium sonneborni TaxID=65129 RepID=A0A8S1QC49_9CILI|nr:unnamed protein product [Paramecium sonneborni]
MGRLQTGYARPVTNRQDAQQENVLKTARVGTRLGTARPMTQGGRYIRLGTASLQQMGDQFIMVDRLDMKKMAGKPVISRILCDYLIYVEHNPRKALQLAAEATQVNNFNDWWWKERLGKAYFMLGLYREAEKQFESSLKMQEMIKTQLQLAKVYLRIDQPITAIELYKKNSERFPHEISYLIGIARVYDQLNQPEKALPFYQNTLIKDNCNIEAVASLGAQHFYLDQPETALQFYKRLLQLGLYTAEIWNNIGLCCFYSGQYDLFYSCFERALSVADDQQRAEIWYNLSHIFINLGDSGTAYQCLKIALCFDSHHGEAYNNLAVVQAKRKEFDKAKLNFQKAMESNEFIYEPGYNLSVLHFNQQDYSQCYQLVQKTLKLFPDHSDSLELNEKVLQVLQQI